MAQDSSSGRDCMSASFLVAAHARCADAAPTRRILVIEGLNMAYRINWMCDAIFAGA